MAKIVISYRRKDSDAITGRIRDRLAQHFGAKSVFMDIDSIPLGIDYRKQIERTLQENLILLAIIGPDWTGPKQDGEPRIFDAIDPVRIEVETALGRGVPTIPVLVGGASMPTLDHLPDSLKELRFHNAAEVSSGLDFHQHVDRLIKAIEQILRQNKPAHRIPIVLTPGSLMFAGGALALGAAVIAGLFAYHPWRAAPPNPNPPSAVAATQPSPTPSPSATASPTPNSSPSSTPAPSPSAQTSVAAAPPVQTTAQPAPAVDAATAAAACDPGSVPIFYDNFKTVDPAWEQLGTDPSTGYYVADGHLVLAAPVSDDVSVWRPTLFANASLCVDVVTPSDVKDPQHSSAGPLFWMKDDNNSYDVMLYPLGGYQINKLVDGKSTSIAEEKNDAIKVGPLAVNKLKLTNKYDNNVLTINGRQVKEFKGQPGKDDSYIGLLAYSESGQVDQWRIASVVMTQPNYANEFTDFGVPAQTTLKEDVGTKTPTKLPGGRLITTYALYEAMLHGSLDGSPFAMIDVLYNAHSDTIRGATRIPDGGASGTFYDDYQSSLRTRLLSLTKNNINMPLIFFCEGAICWESYNAALRAEKIGFSRVYWYRGGLNAWKAAGLPMH